MIHHIDIPPGLHSGDRIEGPISILQCFHMVPPRSGRGVFYKLSLFVKHFACQGSITIYDDKFWPTQMEMKKALIANSFEPGIAESIAQAGRVYLDEVLKREGEEENG